MRPQTQITGRMGELIVELELLKRGWWAANLNAATSNFIGYDLFAAKGGKSVKIRIKAKRSGELMFRWSAKTSDLILPNLNANDQNDFVAAVSFDDTPKGYQIYIIPSVEVEMELKRNHSIWLSGKKSNGEDRKDSSNRIIYMDENFSSVSHGYAEKWRQYLEAWERLE